MWRALAPALLGLGLTRSGDENTSASVSFAERKICGWVTELEDGKDVETEDVEGLEGDGYGVGVKDGMVRCVAYPSFTADTKHVRAVCESITKGTHFVLHALRRSEDAP